MYGHELTAKDLVRELTWAIETDYQRPLMIWGAPGLGKTRITEQVAKEKGLEHRVFRICDKSPVEINGVPVPRETTTQWLPPEGLPKEGRGILLIDEIVRAPFTMQGIAQQLIHERRTMSYCLPDGWFVFAPSLSECWLPVIPLSFVSRGQNRAHDGEAVAADEFRSKRAEEIFGAV